MQPLRGYDSLSLGDLLQGIVPASLSPPNMPDAWNAPNPGSSSIMAAQVNPVPPRQSGITRESLAALKQAMARIAPHLPPDLLQRHYINRLVQLSNPTPATLYPVHSYDTPFATGDRMREIKPTPLLDPNMPTGKDNPFVRAAMARFAASSGANRLLQPVGTEDAPPSPGDLLSSVKPPPLSAPNIPTAMDSPFVRAALGRVYGQAGSDQLIGSASDDELRDASVTGRNPSEPPQISRARNSTNAQSVSDDDGTDDNSKASSSTAWDYLDAGAHWLPVVGGVLDARDDINKGEYGWAAVDAALALSDATLGGAVAHGALKAGSKGLWKNGSKTWAATRPWLGKLWDLPKGTEVHHWALHQKNEGLPEWLVNHPLNLLPMDGSKVDRTTRQFHNAVHGVGKKRFAPDDPVVDYLLRIKHGWPSWAKVAVPAATTSAASNFAKTLKMQYDDIQAHPEWYAQPILPP